MNLLKDIESFNKSHLKHADTFVTTPDGRRLIEGLDSDGKPKVALLSTGCYGFVGDMKPDLQCAEILPGLYLGSQDVAQERDVLEKNKITHILNVATGVLNMFPKRFTYRKLDILDLPETNILDSFDDCFKFISKGRKKGHVLVHCNAGVSRAASICIGYVMKYEQKKFKDAYEFVKSKRERIRPNDGFVSQLKTYEAMLKAEQKH
ncbi:dual specificity protein phosphatase 19-like [Lineus longissimus]|uniref:dual specificity protein phosphatase 19-like n=1 Tax=Lineus longissimus TaxID=88925 RepID=UPI002B4E3204